MEKLMLRIPDSSRFPIVLCFVLLHFSLPHSVENPSSSCDSLIRKGDSLYEIFDNGKALALYRGAWEQCGTDYQALMKYTRALNDFGEDRSDPEYYERAMRYADSLQLRFPDSMQGYFLKAAAAGNLADYRKGKNLVELSRIVHKNILRSIELSEEYCPAHVILGGYYYRVAESSSLLRAFARLLYGGVPDGSYRDAIRELKKALAIDSTNLYAHLIIAQTYGALEIQDSARYHLNRVLELPVTNHFYPELKRRADSLMSLY